MYEASEIIALGVAHQLTQGVKPICMEVESEGVPYGCERIDDIDEIED